MKKIRCTKSVVLMAMAGTLAMGSTLAVRAQAENRDAKLVGTWLFQVSLENCATKAPIGEPFDSLLTFNEGGTMTEATSNPSFYPYERGPGHGVWDRVGQNSFKATSLAFITLNGALQKWQTIAQTIQFTGRDSVKTSSADVKFTTPDGAPLMEGCASATGKRLQLDGVK